MSAPWDLIWLFDHGIISKSLLETSSITKSSHKVMSSLDGDNMETSQELALMVVCAMMSQLDGNERNDFAQETIDSGGVPHLIRAMFSSNTALAGEAKETLLRICETAA